MLTDMKYFISKFKKSLKKNLERKIRELTEKLNGLERIIKSREELRD